MKKVFCSCMGMLAFTLFSLVACTPSAPPTPTVQQVTVQASEFKYDPAQITVKAGQLVRLTLKNAGTVDHELEITGLSPKDLTIDQSQAGTIPDAEKNEAADDAQKGLVHLYTAPNGTSIVQFTPQQTGTFEFFCGIAGHKDSGMVGKLIVQ
jgi:uncharacterized cupredoxin-like copper-binding protein